MRPDFTIVLAGYESAQVDKVLTELERATTRPPSVPKFRVVLRGYERTEVDAYVERLLAALPDQPTH